MSLQPRMSERVETAVPGRKGIELVAFYEEFRDYYPQCEMETKGWFVKHVRPDWWIFDIGANIGYYTILFSQLASQGRVFAFEPTTTATMLRSNLLHNNVQNASVHEVALGARTGLQHERIFRLWGTEGEVKDYPFYRLDDFIAENGIERVDCLKIDVDSFDFDVLRGAEQTLLKHDPVVVIELNHALAKRDQSGAEALAWLSRRGYRKALVLDRYDNFILQRRDGGVADPGGCTSMELLFPPPVRFDERLKDGARRKSPVERVELLNDAALRPAATDGPPGLWRRLVSSTRALTHSHSLQFSDVAGVPIETGSDRWGYALGMSLEPSDSDDTIAIGIGVEVIEGALGIVVCGADLSRFCAPERVLAAMPDLQHVIVKVRRSEARTLIFRNVAYDGSRTLFKVASVEATVEGPLFPRGDSPAP
jgi:FkbM family methyltransferase